MLELPNISSQQQVTWYFTKLVGFQVIWSEDKKLSSDMEGKFQVNSASR